MFEGMLTGVEEKRTFSYGIYPKILFISICCYKRCEIFGWTFGKTTDRNRRIAT